MKRSKTHICNKYCKMTRVAIYSAQVISDFTTTLWFVLMFVFNLLTHDRFTFDTNKFEWCSIVIIDTSSRIDQST